MLPAVSFKKYANPMSLLKADMPIGYKDPTKNVDGGVAGGYSELKEPGEEGKTGIIPRKTSGWHRIVSQKRSSCLGSKEKIFWRP